MRYMIEGIEMSEEEFKKSWVVHDSEEEPHLGASGKAGMAFNNDKNHYAEFCCWDKSEECPCGSFDHAIYECPVDDWQ